MSTWGTVKTWVQNRSTAEKVLLLTPIIGLVAVVVSAIVTTKTCPVTEIKKTCATAACLKTAVRLLQYRDISRPPCDNFYKHACGNFPGKEFSLEKYSLETRGKDQLLQIYKEPIQDNEHEMVTAAKKLFQACTDEIQIEYDHVNAITKALKKAGGWPVLEGLVWNEKAFDWLNSTYLLRELGYHFGGFLGINVTAVNNTYILKVVLGDSENYHTMFSVPDLKVMIEIAKIFGAKNETLTANDMSETRRFYENLLQQFKSVHNSYHKNSIKNYQGQVPFIDWQLFINNIAATNETLIMEDEEVLFPSPTVADKWLKLIGAAGKRVQANFLMWRAVEEAIPYLPSELRYHKIDRVNSNARFYYGETHKNFCFREIEKRFVPSPIAIVADRRFLSAKRRAQVAQMVDHIKEGFVKLVEGIRWINKEDKQMLFEIIRQTSVIIGHPGNYFGDELLDQLKVDMANITTSNDFISLLAQANRNRQSALYAKIRNPKPDVFMDKWYQKYLIGPPEYIEEDNILFIPGSAIRGMFFHEDRTQILNYGSLGALVAYYYSRLVMMLATGKDSNQKEVVGWSMHSSDGFKLGMYCLGHKMDEYEDEAIRIVARHVLMQLVISESVARIAYDRWVKLNEPEFPLSGINYTTNQLFWMSLGNAFCAPHSPYFLSENQYKWMGPQNDTSFVNKMIVTSIAADPRFAKDFSCKIGSRMNPLDRCLF